MYCDQLCLMYDMCLLYFTTQIQNEVHIRLKTSDTQNLYSLSNCLKTIFLVFWLHIILIKLNPFYSFVEGLKH